MRTSAGLNSSLRRSEVGRLKHYMGDPGVTIAATALGHRDGIIALRQPK